MHKIKCLNCNKEFNATRENQKFCSVECYRRHLINLSIKTKLKTLEIMEKE